MSAVACRIRARQAGYLPTWRPGEGSSGAALLDVLGHLAALVEDGLERSIDKQFLSFLDSMGVTLLPARAARAALVFEMSPDAPIDVALPQGTEVGAAIPPALPAMIRASALGSSPAPEVPVVFATERAISLARAALSAVVSVVPATDRYSCRSSGAATGGLFADLEQIPHHLYLGHDALFELPSSATVSLQAAIHGRARAGVGLRWEYATDEGWLAFEPVVDQTRGLGVDGEIVLAKSCGPASAKTSVNGIESYWIRARVDRPLPSPTTAAPPLVDTFRARLGLGDHGLELNAAYADGLRLDTTKDFMPFGPQPAVGSAFVFACDDAFKRAGARITLTITPSPANNVTKAQQELVWEYSTDRPAWRPLISSAEAFEQGTTGRTISFVRPADWAKTAVNGERQHWVRVRLADGSYSATSAGGTPTAFTPPILASMSVAYTVETPPEVPDHCLSLNRFEYVDHSEACRWGASPFAPFRVVPDRLPTLYLGFTRPLPVGLVSLLAARADEADAGTWPAPSRFAWEYRSPRGWSELLVEDGTSGLQQTGLLQFIGPPDLIADDGPDGPLYWVRAVLRDAGPEPPPVPLAMLRANAVWARHRSSVRGEVLGHGDGSKRLALMTQHHPVLDGEIIEVQEWRGPGRSWESLFSDVDAGDLHQQRDAAGAVSSVWVRWHRRAHLFNSEPRDRHYTIDRAEGLVRFGDGTTGMIPPPGCPVRASYDHESGMRGNVPAGVVNQIHSAAPYVESVFNPLPASGGADDESLESSTQRSARSGVRGRGPQQLRHRQRALTASDYEWLARDASPAVAVARCLAATGPEGPWPGWVTVVVAPWGAEPEPQPSAELLREVHAHLTSRAPATVARFVRVVGPTYEPISVTAEVVISDASTAAEIEERLRHALDAYLHPLLGGSTQGWRFGDTIHLSPVARLLEVVDGVDRVTALQLDSAGVVYGDRVPIPPDRLPTSGAHVLNLRPDVGPART